MNSNLTEEKQSWLAPVPQKKTLRAGLYLVATPIGNLEDISIRALNTLANASAILCEDTRVTGKLLKAYGIRNKTSTYNDHSTDNTRNRVIEKIQDGEAVALVSDAGLPLIADPGYKIVNDCIEQGLYVTSIPGANAGLTALQLSGLPSDNFTFIGFLPTKSKARLDVLQRWQNTPSTLIAYETAPRLVKSLTDIHATMPDRRVAVVREITKIYEEARLGTPQQLITHYEENGLPKGEIVLVIQPPQQDDVSEDDVQQALKNALKTMSTKEAAAYVAAQTGWKKKQIYDMALKLK